MLKDGRIEIQDEGSQLIALITDARPGQRVADFCAGAGGKTLAIGGADEKQGTHHRLRCHGAATWQSTERFAARAFTISRPRPSRTSRIRGSSATREVSDQRAGRCAPAPAPERGAAALTLRWRFLGPNPEKLAILQANILESAARLVKPGGRLIYATCSLLREENEERIERFLATHNAFRQVPCSDVVMGSDAKKDRLSIVLSVSEPYLSLTPAQHETDGFFGAVLEREA